jgi:hypothetical protein
MKDVVPLATAIVGMGLTNRRSRNHDTIKARNVTFHAMRSSSMSQTPSEGAQGQF